MEKKVKKNYESPQLTVVTFRTERGYATSSVSGGGLFGLHDPFLDNGGDAWGGSSGGSNHFGGWTDNGNSAWD